MYDTNLISELKNYLLKFDENDIDKEHGYLENGRVIHKKMFTEPVVMLFYWEESCFEGCLCVLWKYKEYFILKSGSFGSCSGCDYWKGTDSLKHLNEKILMSFNDIKIYNKLMDIDFNEYTNYNLKNAFNEFRTNYLDKNLDSNIE